MHKPFSRVSICPIQLSRHKNGDDDWGPAFLDKFWELSSMSFERWSRFTVGAASSLCCACSLREWSAVATSVLSVWFSASSSSKSTLSLLSPLLLYVLAVLLLHSSSSLDSSSSSSLCSCSKSPLILSKCLKSLDFNQALEQMYVYKILNWVYCCNTSRQTKRM